MIFYAYERTCESECLAVGSEDGGVYVACGREEDSDRYKDDAKKRGGGGYEKLYFYFRGFHKVVDRS